MSRSYDRAYTRNFANMLRHGPSLHSASPRNTYQRPRRIKSLPPALNRNYNSIDPDLNQVNELRRLLFTNVDDVKAQYSSVISPNLGRTGSRSPQSMTKSLQQTGNTNLPNLNANTHIESDNHSILELNHRVSKIPSRFAHRTDLLWRCCMDLRLYGHLSHHTKNDLLLLDGNLNDDIDLDAQIDAYRNQKSGPLNQLSMDESAQKEIQIELAITKLELANKIQENEELKRKVSLLLSSGTANTNGGNQDYQTNINLNLESDNHSTADHDTAAIAAEVRTILPRLRLKHTLKNHLADTGNYGEVCQGLCRDLDREIRIMECKLQEQQQSESYYNLTAADGGGGGLSGGPRYSQRNSMNLQKPERQVMNVNSYNSRLSQQQQQNRRDSQSRTSQNQLQMPQNRNSLGRLSFTDSESPTANLNPIYNFYGNDQGPLSTSDSPNFHLKQANLNYQSKNDLNQSQTESQSNDSDDQPHLIIANNHIKSIGKSESQSNDNRHILGEIHSVLGELNATQMCLLKNILLTCGRNFDSSDSNANGNLKSDSEFNKDDLRLVFTDFASYQKKLKDTILNQIPNKNLILSKLRKALTGISLPLLDLLLHACLHGREVLPVKTIRKKLIAKVNKISITKFNTSSNNNYNIQSESESSTSASALSLLESLSDEDAAFLSSVLSPDIKMQNQMQNVILSNLRYNDAPRLLLGAVEQAHGALCRYFMEKEECSDEMIRSENNDY